MCWGCWIIIGSLTWMWADVTNFLADRLQLGWACTMDPTGASYGMYQGFSTKTVPGLQAFIPKSLRSQYCIGNAFIWKMIDQATKSKLSRLLLRNPSSLPDCPSKIFLISRTSGFRSHIKISQGAHVFRRRRCFLPSIPARIEIIGILS